MRLTHFQDVNFCVFTESPKVIHWIKLPTHFQECYFLRLHWISESPKVIHWFNESSCLHISRMFTFLLAVIESPDSENFWRDIFQAAYFNPHFQDVDFWARHDWKFKGDIIKIICYLHISRVLTFGSSWWHRWKVKGDRFQDPKL